MKLFYGSIGGVVGFALGMMFMCLVYVHRLSTPKRPIHIGGKEEEMYFQIPDELIVSVVYDSLGFHATWGRHDTINHQLIISVLPWRSFNYEENHVDSNGIIIRDGHGCAPMEFLPPKY